MLDSGRSFLVWPAVMQQVKRLQDYWGGARDVLGGVIEFGFVCMIKWLLVLHSGTVGSTIDL